jgi:hypothetical protein
MSNSRVSKKITATAITVTTTALIIAIIIFLLLPSVDIYYGMKYRNNPRCNNSTLMSPSNWLISTGALNIILGVLIVLAVMFQSVFGVVTLSWLIVVFQLITVITGGIMLWRDNYYCQPGDLRAVIWFTLLFSFLAYSNQLQTSLRAS